MLTYLYTINMRMCALLPKAAVGSLPKTAVSAAKGGDFVDAVQSREDYLENILILSKKKGMVRNVDIALQMNFSRPSVSIAIKKLEKEGYVSIDEDGFISLTAKGRKRAEQVYERHLVLTLILMEVGVEKNQASLDACKVEHCLSDESFAKIREYYLKYIHDKK